MGDSDDGIVGVPGPIPRSALAISRATEAREDPETALRNIAALIERKKLRLSIAEPGRLGATYDMGKQIGRGKFSTVWAAVRRSDGTNVAVKRVAFDVCDPVRREKTLKEIALVQDVSHPHIIAFLEGFVEGSELLLISELAEAGDLKRQLAKARKRGVRLEERVVWKYFAQLADAIRYLHSCRKLHRDLKPANVLLTLRGVVKVGDLGLGRALSDDTLAAHSRVGTPLYMSPEVLQGTGYNASCDVWSLGCILYELAALLSPFKEEGINLVALFHKICAGAYPPLPDTFSPTLRGLVAAMLQVDPAARPDATCIAACAAAAHEAMQQGRPPPPLPFEAPPAPPWPPPPLPRRSYEEDGAAGDAEGKRETEDPERAAAGGAAAWDAVAEAVHPPVLSPHRGVEEPRRGDTPLSAHSGVTTPARGPGGTLVHHPEPTEPTLVRSGLGSVHKDTNLPSERTGTAARAAPALALLSAHAEPAAARAGPGGRDSGSGLTSRGAGRAVATAAAALAFSWAEDSPLQAARQLHELLLVLGWSRASSHPVPPRYRREASVQGLVEMAWGGAAAEPPSSARLAPDAIRGTGGGSWRRLEVTAALAWWLCDRAGWEDTAEALRRCHAGHCDGDAVPLATAAALLQAFRQRLSVEAVPPLAAVSPQSLVAGGTPASDTGSAAPSRADTAGTLSIALLVSLADAARQALVAAGALPARLVGVPVPAVGGGAPEGKGGDDGEAGVEEEAGLLAAPSEPVDEGDAVESFPSSDCHADGCEDAEEEPVLGMERPPPAHAHAHPAVACRPATAAAYFPPSRSLLGASAPRTLVSNWRLHLETVRASAQACLATATHAQGPSCELPGSTTTGMADTPAQRLASTLLAVAEEAAAQAAPVSAAEKRWASTAAGPACVPATGETMLFRQLREASLARQTAARDGRARAARVETLTGELAGLQEALADAEEGLAEASGARGEGGAGAIVRLKFALGTLRSETAALDTRLGLLRARLSAVEHHPRGDPLDP